MATNTDGGTTASLSNTPQAKDDFYLADEDQVLYFAVMANDLGGSAKVLWSIDDTSDDGSTDLVAKDVAGVCEYSELGAKISLTSDGRIKYDTTLLDSLAAGQTVIDQFTYAIRLSNGTLSWATVTVTLTGTNDGPVAVADVTAVNEDSSISGSVAGNDSDIDSGAVLSYALVDPAPTGLTFNPDGSWSFDASSYDSLDEGEELVLVVPYTVTDEHGASSSSTLTITVTGTNDTPVAVADVAAVNEDASTSGSVATNDSDADAGATLSYALDDPAPAGLTFNADGSWSFDASSYDSLNQDEELVLVIPYTVTDEHGASSSANLTITITGTNDTPVAVADVAAVDEDASISGNVGSNDSDADAGATLSYALDDPAPAGLTFNADGSWTFDASSYDSLNQDEELVLVIPYTVTDEHGASSGASLTITVTGTNDTPVAVADVAAVNEDASTSGSVASNDSDADGSAVLSYALDNPAPAGLSFNADGSWSFDASSYDSLDQDEELVLVVPYTVTDEHGASSGANLTITVTGTNDTPVAVADVAAVNEDASTSGSVATNDSDADAGAVLSYALDDPAPAGLTFNADGSWSFDASSYDSLDQDEELVLVVPYTVTDEHGASSGANLTITVTGTNDAALISAVAGGDYDVVEAGGVANGTAGDGFAGGQVTVSDADDGEAVFQAPPSLAGTYGTFTFDPDTGQWTYVLDNSLPATEALNVGDSVTDTLTVTSADGTDTHDIVVTITGTNDSAVIGGTTSGSVTEAAASDPGTPTANGTLTAADVDNAPDTFVAVSAPAASDNGYGTFTMTAGGAWTYTLDNGNAAVDALATGGSLVDSFTVQSVDGTTQTITVTINGATDAIILPPTESGADPNDFDNLFAGSAIAGGPVTNNGSNGGDTIHGSNSTSADNLSGGNGVDQIYGHDGGDNINGQNGADMSLYGQAGNDTITGGSGADQIFGGSGDDTIYGNEPPAGNVSGDAGDTIYGGSGNDTIYGQPGNDIIIGGYGADTLTGGAGDDSFRYLSTLDTNDIITDFMASGNDQIDLSAIDANPGGSNDPFAWGGDDPTAHGLWFSYDAGTNTTTLYGDTDGNAGTAEFVLTLQNYSGFNAYNNPLTPPPDITL